MRDRRLLEYAKSVRSKSTPAEARLWYQLRARRFGEYKFRRQTVIGKFIADFTCRAAMLVIELDGDTHALLAIADEQRTSFLNEQGWRVSRVANAEVMGNVEGVLPTIETHLGPSLPTSLREAILFPEGERKGSSYARCNRLGSTHPCTNPISTIRSCR